MSDNCSICGESLNISQYSKDGKYKSCPSCSQKNGKEHVYYKYPEHFGTTKKRASLERPEGPQSHCERCRSNGRPYPEEILCSKIDR